jgi:hypothetical protein
MSQSLLSEGLTLVGTAHKNKASIPPEFLPQKNRPEQSSDFGFTKNATLVSYVPKKNKVVQLLSTMHHDSHVAVANANKPEIITYYNETKSGKRRTNRSPFAYFMSSLDVCGVWTATYADWHKGDHSLRRRFLRELSELFVQTIIERRSSTGLQKPIHSQ